MAMMTASAATLPILSFHAFDDAPYSMIVVKPTVFMNGIGKLLESGYHSISLMAAADCLRQNRSFPRRSFVVTFDDGYQSVYKQAFPVLQRYSLSATVFLTVGDKAKTGAGDRLPPLEGREMLSWAEIREMHQWGITFAAHTLTHPDLTRLPADQVKSEICDSKAVIEDVLGVCVTAFAYPYGRLDLGAREIVERHFACACSNKLGLVRPASDPYALERVDAYCLRKDWGFEIMRTRLFPPYLQAYRVLRRIRMTLNSSRP
jgi:peptidoglycan/xylan/chitin deacetylase (PgdA/CDA1 family)